MSGMVEERILERKRRPYWVRNDLLTLETVYQVHYAIRNSPSLRGRKQPFRQHMPGMEHRHITRHMTGRKPALLPKTLGMFTPDG